MTDINPNEAIEFIYKNAPKYAKAKAERAYIEQFRKSKKAMLVMASNEKTALDKESSAYAHEEYTDLLDAYKIAIEIEESLRWQLIAAQARVEIWRTNSANNRAMDGAAR